MLWLTGVTSSARPAPAVPPSADLRVLLVVTPGAGDPDGLFQELSARAGYLVRLAGSPGAAEDELRGWPVVLVIAAPGVPTGDVGLLLAARDRLRPGIPALVVRNRQAEEPPAWARRGVGVLRCPLLPEALSRSVDVVLGLAGAGGRPVPGGRPRR
jgi:hypothetical protein